MDGAPTPSRFNLTCSVTALRRILAEAVAAARRRRALAAARRSRGTGSTSPARRRLGRGLLARGKRGLSPTARATSGLSSRTSRSTLGPRAGWPLSGAGSPPVRHRVHGLPSPPSWSTTRRVLLALELAGGTARLGGLPDATTLMGTLVRRPRGGRQFVGTIKCLGAFILAGEGRAPGCWRACARRRRRLPLTRRRLRTLRRPAALETRRRRRGPPSASAASRCATRAWRTGRAGRPAAAPSCCGSSAAERRGRGK